MTPAALNAAAAAQARTWLLACCHSTRWADRLLAGRPYPDESALRAAADALWWQLERADWLEAFAAHPDIGDLDTLAARYADTRSRSAAEQAGVEGAPADVLVRLSQGNALYRAQFGYRFIVCASGRSADEMLALLEARLSHAPDVELRIAAEEQRKIFQIRLGALP